MNKNKIFSIAFWIFYFAFCVFQLLRHDVSYEAIVDVDGDARTYHFLAEQISEKHIYAERWPEANPYRAFRPPFYPMVLSVFHSVGLGDQGMIYFQWVLWILSGLLLFKIAKFLNFSIAGYFTAAFWILWPPITVFCFSLMSEILYSFLLLLALYLLYLVNDKKRSRDKYLFFAVLGLAVITRGTTMPVVYIGILFYVLYSFFIKKVSFSMLISVFKGNAIFTLPLLVILSVTTIRNYLVLDKFVMVSSNSGTNLFLGTTDFTWEQPDEWEELMTNEVAIYNDLNEVEASDKIKEKYKSRVLENPVGYIKLKVSQAFKYLIELSAKPSSIFVEKSSLLLNGLLSVFFIGGLIVMVKQKLFALLPVLALFFGLFLGAVIVFYSPRFGVPFLPFYFIICGLGFEKYWKGIFSEKIN
ncbi:MAG: glycosyltransferase family 39 protein [Bacteroidetes bacterium]|nr:glycosyltransferase family 39 protein [Bacteroidota bacterium]